MGNLSKKEYESHSKYASRLFETEFGVSTKVVVEGDLNKLVRTLCDVKTKEVHYRAIRSYMVIPS